MTLNSEKERLIREKLMRRSFKMKVTVTAAGSDKFEPAKKTVTVVIKVR